MQYILKYSQHFYFRKKLRKKIEIREQVSNLPGSQTVTHSSRCSSWRYNLLYLHSHLTTCPRTRTLPQLWQTPVAKMQATTVKQTETPSRTQDPKIQKSLIQNWIRESPRPQNSSKFLGIQSQNPKIQTEKRN